METPDGVRQVKAPEWSTVVPVGEVTDKVEVPIKVGNRKHTAIVLGPLARAAAEVEKGDTVIVTGHYFEKVWQEGKPPKKEIHNVHAMWRNGAELRGQVPVMPLDETPKGTPHEPPMPLDDGDVYDEGTWGDLTAEATAVFDPMSLPVMQREAGEFESMAEAIRVERIEARPGSFITRMWLRIGKERVEFLLPEGKAVEMDAISMEGETIHAQGSWAKAGGRSVVAGTAVRR